MVPFTYTRAATEAEALAAGRAGARFLAGGTTLIDLMRETVERPSRLLDINGLPYRHVQLTPRGLEIGALARMADVAADGKVAETFPVVTESLLASASPQLRNMASIGGNLLQRTRCLYFRDVAIACNKRESGSGCAALGGENRTHAIFGGSDHCVATHASDLAVALVALEAVVRTRGHAGERLIPIEELYRLPGETPHLEHTLRPGELMVAVEVPMGPHARRSHYLKVRDRASYEFALVSTAVALHIDGGVIRSARLAAGGVGTKPWRLRQVEAALVGRQPVETTWRLAAERAVEGARPLAHNGFKVELLKRTLVRALETIGGDA